MLNRLLIFMTAVGGMLVVADAAQAQQGMTQDVIFTSQTLYAYPAFTSLPCSGKPLFAGEMITTRPLVTGRQNVRPNPAPRRVGQPSRAGRPAARTGFAPVFPAPGGC